MCIYISLYKFISLPKEKTLSSNRTMENGESSCSKPAAEIWAKLVPLDSRYSDVDLMSNEMLVCSEVKVSSSEKQEWCNITRNQDLCSATMENKREMENRRSVNSPRRILSFSQNRRAKVFFPDPYERPPSDFEDRGPKPSEVYGFVGSITTVVATVVFLVWAYVPEHWLHSVGIYYYPCRYWALAAPTYAMVTVVLGIGFYIGLNFMVTPPPTSFNTIFDEYSREPVSLIPAMNEDEPPIPPMFDISISQINDIMFKDVK